MKLSLNYKMSLLNHCIITQKAKLFSLKDKRLNLIKM